MPRKTRVDPAQEYLLQKKDKVNKEISALISLWIDLKRALNGYPAPGIGVTDKSDIKFPLPNAIDQAQDRVRTLADNIISQIDDVQRQQESYSRTRRKSRKEVAQHPVSTSPKTEEVDKEWDVKAPVNAPGLASANYILIKQASNSVSRLMSHVFQAFNFKDKDRWLRLRMLRSAAGIEDSLVDIEDLLLSKEPNSIPKAVYTINNVYYLLNNNLINKLGQYIDSAIQLVQNSINKAKEEKKQISPLNSVKFPDKEFVDLKQVDNINFPDKEFVNVNNFDDEITDEDIITEFDPEQDKQDTSVRAKHSLDVSTEYLTKLEGYVQYAGINSELAKQLAQIRNLITSSKIMLGSDPYQALVNSRKITDDLTIASLNVINNYSKPENTASSEYALYSYASNQFTRSFKKYWMELTGGKDKSLRIEAAGDIKASRQALNKVMDDLEEKNADMGKIIEGVNLVIQYFKSALLKIIELAEIHNSLSKIERSQTRLEGKRFKLDIISETDKNKLVRILNSLNENFLSKMTEYKNKSEELVRYMNSGAE